MGLYDHWPYTNFHELNLTWLLREMAHLQTIVENFVALNTIKYADPIQWNITTQYETNTVVIDPNTGTAYISSQPVPSGVLLTNTDYWSVIFTLDVLSVNQNITLRDDGSNILATFSSAAGDWLLWNGTLYKVSQTINVNEAYVVGYNIDRYTVELFIKDYIAALESLIGDLDNLTTTDKSNLVAAINEVLTTLNSVTGDLNNLTTTDKTDLVSAINEVDLQVDNLEIKFNNLDIVNVKDYGALGDGVEDDTAAIQAAITAAQSSDVCKLVFFPSGIYRITDTLDIGYVGDKKLSSISIMGAGQYNSQILCDGDFDAIVYEGDDTIPNNDGYLYGFHIRDIYIHYAGNDSSKTGLTIKYAGVVSVENVRIRYFKTGVYLTGCGNSVFEHVGISANVAQAIGFDVGDLSVSNYYVGCFFAASGNAVGVAANSKGFNLTRGTIADQNINYFDVGGGATHAIFIDGTEQISGQQHGDINITDLVCESYYGISIYHLTTHPNVNIIGGWFNCLSDRPSIALTDSDGIMIRDAVFVFNSPVLYDNKGAVALIDANCSNITIMGCLCRNQYLFNGAAGGGNMLIANNQIVIDAAMQASLVGINGDRCIVEGNIFKGAPIRYVRAYSGATNSLVVNNVGSGDATGTAFQNDAGVTTILDNNID